MDLWINSVFATLICLVIGDREYASHSHHGGHYKNGVHVPDYDRNIILGSLNRNDDFSKMSMDEARKKFSNQFNIIDSNKNGLLDNQEIASFVFSYFKKVDENEAREKLLDVDENSNGYVEWEEYLKKVYGYELSEIEEFRKDLSQDMAQFLKLVDDDMSRFSMADWNKDLKLNSTEYGAFLHPTNYKYMHDYEINLTLSQIDSNGDGFITFNEYLGDSTPGYEQRVVDHENFRSYDANDDDKLDRNEIRVWLLPDKNTMAKEEAKHLIDETDTNGDGQISIEEIVNKYDVWMGSAATQYGEGLRHDPSEL